jgi:transcriptional regulator GlxA family with amidase domain
METGDGPTEIAILAYPRAQSAAIHGLTDLFVEASRISRRLAADTTAPPALRVTHWRPSDKGSGPELGFDTHPGRPSHPAVVIAPPTLAGPPIIDTIRPFAQWMRERHDKGATLCSICGGTFVLAESGLLSNRAATTHWGYAEELARLYPDIQVDGDKLIVEDGDIISSGGIMSWTDVGLKLIDRFLGSAVMLATARFFLIDTAGREQRFYSTFSPKLDHGDEAVLKVQHWLQKEDGHQATLAAMALHAGLEERTFLRRFRKATGLNPTEYSQRLRIGKARELLELTNRTIDQVAWAVGYDDPGSFRKTFHKLIGLKPGDYRKRFSVTPGGVGG